MPSGSNRTRTVFIGNISFDATEDELRTLFSSVGPVVNLRLVVDRETGKRKGFGFAEYSDTETALAAVRNLNEFDIHGRALRVNIAEQDTKTTNSESATMGNRKRKGGEPWGGAGAPGIGSDPRGGGGGAIGGDPRATAPLAETYLPPSADPIASYVEKLGRAQMFELALQAKHFALSQPDEAARLMATNPSAVAALNLVLDRLAGPHWPPQQATFGGTGPLAGITSSQPAAPMRASGGGGMIPPPAPVITKTEPPPPPPPAMPAAEQRFPPALEAAAAAMGVPAAVLHQQITQLTPEALLALPPEQQQQVHELQQMLRG